MVIALWIVPAAYVAVLGLFALRGAWRALPISLIVVVLTLAAGVWAIQHNHDRTAWGYYFLLPSVTGAAGLLSLAFVALAGSARWALRLGGEGGLLAALAVPIAEVVRTVRRNAEIARSAEEIARQDQKLIDYRRRIDSETS